MPSLRRSAIAVALVATALSTVLVVAPAAGADGPVPGDLAVSARVDEPPRFVDAGRDDAADLILRLERTPRRAFRGTVLVDTGAGERRVPYDLAGTRSTDVKIPVSIPAGLADSAAEVSIEVLAGATQLASMSVRLERSDAWFVSGPFPGGVGESHAKELPPETDASLETRYELADGAVVEWTPLPMSARRADGSHDLGLVFDHAVTKTAYVQTRVRANHAGPARLLVGSDDSVRAWVNGQEVLDRPLRRGCRPGEDQVPVVLRKGENTLLLKICQDGGAWAFACSLDDGAGAPVAELVKLTSVRRAVVRDSVVRPVEVTRDAAVFSWRTDAAVPSRLSLVAAAPGRAMPVSPPSPKVNMVQPAAGAVRRLVEDRVPKTSHRLRVDGLEPGTRYIVSIVPAPDGATGDTLTFVTEPPERKAAALRLRVAVVIFSNAVPARDADRDGAKTPLPAEAVDLAKARCEAASAFFFRNSAMRLWMDNEFLVDDTFHAFPDDAIYGVGLARGAPHEAALRRLLAERGEVPQDYDALAYVTLARHWDGRDWVHDFSGGGTYGPDIGFGIGNSSWKGGHDCAWLYVHEVGHQVDGLYHWSGCPEYLFNHFQPWDDTAHRHGEHYDGNAWLLREWAGVVTREHQGWPPRRPGAGGRGAPGPGGAVVVVDAPAPPRVADDAPSLPLDERRLGSDPARLDTDADGLDDLGEALATIGADQGLQAVWAGRADHHRCDPRNPDTDGDGLRDGDDSEPLCAASTTVGRATPKVDGDVADGEWLPFVRLDEPEVRATFHISFDGDALHLAARCETPVREIVIYVDADDDGWYVGRDNLHLVVDPSSGFRGGREWRILSEGALGMALHNCGVQGKWPFYDGPLSAESATFAATRPAGRYEFEVALSRDPALGLDLTPGERMGILIAVLPEGGVRRPGAEGKYTPFEPHVFFRFALGE